MSKTENDLSIKDMIRAITDELLASRDERLAAGDPAVFQVEELSLEISFVATSSKNASGGFHFWVIKADAGMKYDEQSVHKVVLKLKAAQPSDAEPFGLEEPLRPRRVKSKST